MAALPQPLSEGDEIVTPAMAPPGLSRSEAVVVVKVVGDPVAVRQGNSGRRLSRPEKDRIKEELRARQDALRGGIAALGGTVLGSYQSALNGLKVRIARERVGALAALPGVTAVKALPKHERSHVKSVPLIGAPQVWQSLALRGEGVKVGIIDTGIDYTHANFGGPGTPAAYAAAHAAEALPADPALFGPAAPRIKGGIDLVGDAYDGDNAPAPDANPLDCNGHGSHVAGSAAGSGVKADGTTYSGPYDAATIGANSWLIGPGVAPKADLYAIRVFGCEGSTRATVDAIEWAVDNDMDVINMSLGSPFGERDDPSAEAATNAAQAGVIVVTSAGNSGPQPYLTGSPGTADGAIAVAANDSIDTFPGAALAFGGVTRTAINANGFPLPPSSTYTIKVLTGANALGCSVANFGGPLPPNTLVVVQRGVCARVAKAIFGQQAGAAAVVMVNNANALPPFEGQITFNPDDGVPFTVTIPFLGVRSSDNAVLTANQGNPITVTPAVLANPGFRGFASFSSGGGRTGDSALKPDVTAPGVSIQSTNVGTGNGMLILSGTSMASPHVAGVAALTRQANPGWTVEEIKAAVVGTGSPSDVAGFVTRRGGSGLVQPVGATATRVTARPNGSPFAAALSFGFAELKNDFAKSATIHLRNHGSTGASFNVSQALASGAPHSLSFSPATVSVGPGASANVVVSLSVPAATAPAGEFGDVAGQVVLTPASPADNGGIALRVPYYLVPRARANVETRLGQLRGTNPSTTASVTNANGATAGTADFYAWGIEDRNDNNGSSNGDRNVTADVRAVGMQAFPFPSGAVPTRRLLVWAVNTFNRWSNASTSEYDIFVDVDNDGIDDYVVVGVDQGAVQLGSFNGVMGSFVFSTRSPGASIAFLAVAPPDSSTALLPVLSTQLCRAAEPCLSVSNPRLTYRIVSFDLANGGAKAVPGSARFNPWTSAISNGAFLTVAPGAAAATTIAVNSAEFAQTPALGVMVVSYENAAGTDQAQLVRVEPK